MSKDEAIQLFKDVCAWPKVVKHLKGIAMHSDGSYQVWVNGNLVAALAAEGRDWEPINPNGINELVCLGVTYKLSTEQTHELRNRWLGRRDTPITEAEVRLMISE